MNNTAASSENPQLRIYRPDGEKIATCEKHGEYQSRLLAGKIWSMCPQCREEAERLQAERERQAEDRRTVERIHRVLCRAGIPPRFMYKGFADFVTDTPERMRVRQTVYDYAAYWDEMRTSGRSMIFSGPCGTGKTLLACILAQELLIFRTEFNTVRFSTVLRLMRTIKETWDKHEKSEREVIQSFVEPDLLILDEVGVQFGTETERTMLFDVLNERYEDLKPSLLISNLNGAGIIGFLGERTFDRFTENGGGLVFFEGESKRRERE